MQSTSSKFEVTTTFGSHPMPSEMSCSILSTKIEEFEVSNNFFSFSLRPVFDILSNRQIFLRNSSFSSIIFDREEGDCFLTIEWRNSETKFVRQRNRWIGSSELRATSKGGLSGKNWYQYYIWEKKLWLSTTFYWHCAVSELPCSIRLDNSKKLGRQYIFR